MCGFVGVVGKNSNIKINKLLETVKHRGPDSSNIVVSERFSLAHSRLSIVDLDKKANQPLTSYDGRYLIVFNGELYNSFELRKEIISTNRGTLFLTDHSDTETILNSYIIWGRKCLEKFRGMFSFVIYDKINDKVFLARDHFGQKPLYYWVNKDWIAFGSELKAVAMTAPELLSIDQKSISRFLLHDCIPAPFTLFKEIKKVSPGECISYNCNGLLEKNFFWKPIFKRDLELNEESKEELERLINQSVKRTLVSDVPISLMLSGGVDSAVVANFVKKTGLHRDAYSIGFIDPLYDESMFTIKSASSLDLNLNLKMLKTEDLIYESDFILSKLDEPLGDTGLISYSALSRNAARNFKVAIGGDGGDEIFFGYDTYRAFLLANENKNFLKAYGHFFSKFLNLIPSSDKRISSHLKLKRFFLSSSFPESMWPVIWMSGFTPPSLEQLIPDQGKSDELFNEYLKDYNIQEVMSLDDFNSYYLNVYLPEKVLMKVDRASMAQGLEIRSPLLDLDLFSFVSRLKINELVNKFDTKIALRNQSMVPKHIRRLPKRGFASPVSSILSSHFKFKSNFMSSFLNGKQLENLLREHQLGIANNSQILWNLYVLKNGWYSKYF